jgi:cytochrome b6-f complex subunit 7
MPPGPCCCSWQPEPGRTLLNKEPVSKRRPMASEIFGTAALFWVLIPVGLAGGALLLKLADKD